MNIEDEPDFHNKGLELEKEGKFEEAEQVYRKATEMYPDDFDPHYSLGKLLKKLKRYEEAKKQLKIALKKANEMKKEEPEMLSPEVIDMITDDLKKCPD